MSVILCFGDSLTYGFDPATGGRFPPQDRWPEVLAAGLGVHTVISEGLPGRTTVFDSPYTDARSGRAMLAPTIESHVPVDLVILMLGTNDLQRGLGLSARHSASGLWTLVDIVNRSDARACLVVAPPYLRDPKGFMGVFFTGQEAESEALTEHFRTICEQTATPFFAAADVVSPSPVDGVHLDPAGQRALGQALVPVVKSLLG